MSKLDIIKEAIAENKTSHAALAAEHRKKEEEFRKTPVSRFVAQFGGDKAGRVRERFISYHAKRAHQHEKAAAEELGESVTSDGYITKNVKRSPWVSVSSRADVKAHMKKKHGDGTLTSTYSSYHYKDVSGKVHHYYHEGDKIRYSGSYFRP
jgi:hypothetical protein